ncbi:MAG: F-box/WD repeat-containing protein [Verrucomicrobia bacterium]|nr:F-box/WD repeat-containing protein [Verrucomicrobiota bacterium]
MSINGENPTLTSSQAHPPASGILTPNNFHEQLFGVLPSDTLAMILSQLKLPQIASFSLASKFCHAISFQLDNLWRQLFTNVFSIPLPKPQSCCLAEYKHQHVLNTNLKNGAHKEQILTGHEGSVRCVIQADGKIISGSNDTTMKVWDLEKGKCLTTLEGHEGAVSALTFDKGKIVSGSIDGSIKAWNVETGECLHTLFENDEAIACLAVNKGKVISGSMDSTIKIWDLESEKCLTALKGHQGPITSLAVANELIFSASSDGTIKVWDLETGECITTINEHCVSLVINNGKIYAASIDNTIKILDIESGECLQTLKGHDDYIVSLTIVNDKIISCSFDNVVKIWDAETGKCLHTMHGSKGVILDMTYADGKVISGSNDNTIKIWDLSPQKILDEIVALLKSNHSDTAKALKKFLKLPNFIKNKVYEEFSKLLQNHEIHYPGNIQTAFLDPKLPRNDLRILAIQNFLLKLEAERNNSPTLSAG